jgi:hypothetical protein
VPHKSSNNLAVLNDPISPISSAILINSLPDFLPNVSLPPSPIQSLTNNRHSFGTPSSHIQDLEDKIYTLTAEKLELCGVMNEYDLTTQEMLQVFERESATIHRLSDLVQSIFPQVQVDQLHNMEYIASLKKQYKGTNPLLLNILISQCRSGKFPLFWFH